MNKVYFLLILGLLGSSCTFQPESEFVVTRASSSSASVSKMKEQLADRLGEMLKSTPPILTLVAQLQEGVLDQVELYLAPSKGCFWQTANKGQLEVCLKQAERYLAELGALTAKLEESVQYIRRLTR